MFLALGLTDTLPQFWLLLMSCLHPKEGLGADLSFSGAVTEISVSQQGESGKGHAHLKLFCSYYGGM